MTFCDLELEKLFALIIPTLPRPGRFVFAEGVLVDCGPDTVCPVTVFTTTLCQREIGSAMASIHTQLHSHETADQLGTKVTFIKLPCRRVASSIALVLLLLERSFTCAIPDVPQWVPVLRAILDLQDDGMTVQSNTSTAPPSTWISWLRRLLPQHLQAIDAVFKAQRMVRHAPLQVGGGENVPASTPPRPRNIAVEKAMHRAREHLKKVDEDRQRSLRSRQRAFKRQG